MFYMDTSALAKLVVAESETDALRDWLGDRSGLLIACDLVRTELMRSVRRVAPDRVIGARAVLDGVTLMEVTTPIFEAAGRLEPSALRTLDSLHLAAALTLGDELTAMVTYDQRLASAVTANGVTVLAPGQSDRL